MQLVVILNTSTRNRVAKQLIRWGPSGVTALNLYLRRRILYETLPVVVVSESVEGNQNEEYSTLEWQV